MFMAKWIIFLVTVLSISNLACGFEAYDFDQDQFTKTEPNLAKLTGTYIPTEKTIEALKSCKDLFGDEPTDVSISLFPDGTFEMHVSDRCLVGSFQFQSSNHAISLPDGGTWKVESEDWWWQIEFEFESGNTNTSNNSFDGTYLSTNISGEHPPYTIWIYIGDPNRDPILKFEQITENP